MVKNQFILTSQAKQDIKDIWLYITNDSIRAADNVLECLEQAFYKLANNPNMGSKREDLTNKPLRFWIVYNYYIIYDPNTNPLQILRIISSYRNIENF